MLYVIVLSVIMLNVIKVNVIKVNVVILIVVILSVVAPYASMVVTYPIGAPFWYSPANATLGSKGFPETNALAYLYIASLQQKKSLTTFGTDCQIIGRGAR
jgi:hypothetical protein